MFLSALIFIAIIKQFHRLQQIVESISVAPFHRGECSFRWLGFEHLKMFHQKVKIFPLLPSERKKKIIDRVVSDMKLEVLILEISCSS